MKDASNSSLDRRCEESDYAKSLSLNSNIIEYVSSRGCHSIERQEKNCSHFQGIVGEAAIVYDG